MKNQKAPLVKTWRCSSTKTLDNNYANCVLLGGLASFVPRIQYTYDLLESFPKDMPSREGFTLISDRFSAGELAPVKVVVDTKGKELPIKQELEIFFRKYSERAKRGKRK